MREKRVMSLSMLARKYRGVPKSAFLKQGRLIVVDRIEVSMKAIVLKVIVVIYTHFLACRVRLLWC